MKKRLIKSLIVMSISLMTVPIFANNVLDIKDGGEKIVTTERKARAVEIVGGGTWDYGVVDNTLYSGYYHGKLYHSSTATSYYGTNKDYADARDTSYAKVRASGRLGTDKVNWNTYN